MKIAVVSGDVARIPADTLITAINSGGMWFGGIDGVIMRLAGNLFHSQAVAAMPLSHGQVVVARGGKGAHSGAFENVTFVVDDLKGPLSEIIYAGLKGAADAGFSTVSLPTIRMGVILGSVKSVEEAVRQMASGVRRFIAERSGGLESITFVVYDDLTTKKLLEEALA